MKKRNLILMASAAGVILAGLPYGRIDTSCYEIRSAKIHHDIKMCVLADVHCRRFGENQSRIVKRIKEMNPDLIIIAGDLFDYDRNYEISFELIDALKDYPVYFTSGNHDVYLEKDIDALRKRLKEKGVHVLEDQGEVVQVHDEMIEIYGMSDHGRKPVIQASDLRYMYYTDNFRILISHRPNYIEFYRQAPVDLIISGHAHGGQWRIPFMHKGIYAPQLGLFPKYTEGMHETGGHWFLITRGLASGKLWLPRLYNNPEICLVTLKGEDDEVTTKGKVS